MRVLVPLVAGSHVLERESVGASKYMVGKFSDFFSKYMVPKFMVGKNF